MGLHGEDYALITMDAFLIRSKKYYNNNFTFHRISSNSIPIESLTAGSCATWKLGFPNPEPTSIKREDDDISHLRVRTLTIFCIPKFNIYNSVVDRSNTNELFVVY